MNSFYKSLFLALQERITAEAPEVAFIDQNVGQYGFDDFRAKVAFPAVLIDFPNTSFSALNGNAQLGSAVIEISLFFDIYAQTYHFAPDDTKELGLQYFEIEQKIFKALQGWDANGLCTPLVRTDAKSQNNNEIGMRIRQLYFTTEYEDYTLEDEEYKEVEFSFLGEILK